MMQIQPEIFLFQDDGRIPNSAFPVLVYRAAFASSGVESAEWLEHKFASNDWTNSWRDSIFPFLHYHSTAHEVLGIYNDSAIVRLGGDIYGKDLKINTGDIIVLPAGTGHQRLSPDNGLAGVGAYANGQDYDLLKGAPGDRPQADEQIRKIPFPEKDPLLGREGGLEKLWKPQQ